MRENICSYLMQTHVLFILSLVLLWFNTTTATSLGHKLVVATGGATNTCIDIERQALLDLKARVVDNSHALSTWRPEEEEDCCKWKGVTCNKQTGHVTMLDLSYYGVAGEVSLSLVSLTYLNHLNLSSCYFRGALPPFIGSMTELTSLDLSFNEFTGTIPMSISSLTGLTFLNLEANQFVGTSTEFISNMTQLIYLNLHYNQFTGSIPRSIGSLTGLKYLDLGDNQFVGTIPISIGYLANLTQLDLRDNHLSGIIPGSIGSLTKLTHLYLGYNFLHGTIPQLGNLTNLLHLSLGYLGSCRVENLDWLSSLSSLTYLYMDGISLAKANNWVNLIIGLQNLEELDLSDCDLSKVMHPYSSVVNSSSYTDTLYLCFNNLNSSSYGWLCPLVGNKLTNFYVYGNTLDGKLSDFLSSLSCTSATLDYLDASSNQLKGSLSDNIQNFSSLETLHLESNKLNGTISDKLWQLPKLKELYLSFNSLRGVLSENIGKSNLKELDLSYNSLEGVFFYDDKSNLSMSVEKIYFSSNKLGPHFPKWIQKLKNLVHLDLSNNSITETIPTDYQWASSQLRVLDLSLNIISGTLPESLSRSKLEIVDLSCNNLYGPIPTFSASINYLDLSRNALTGILPDSLKNLTYLKALNLGHNILSGYIPPVLGYLGQLETLSLHNNSFSGELPLSLKNCTKLSLLDLGANKLNGNIPVWIGTNLLRLYALSLKSNKFSGAIPSEICQLVSLQILDLSFNNLHGTIPSCVHNLTFIVQKGLFTKDNIHRYLYNYTLGKWYYSTQNSYIDHLLIEWQGKVNEFSRNLGLVKTIDLSTNRLTGQIPYEITNLQGLVLLNLSHNTLLGEIPKDIGQMTELQILDLSKNSFSGGLPSSMSKLNFLNYLDVSHNKLSGRIPSGTQLQTFEPSRYIGNARLCGPPLTKYCPGDKDLEVTPVVGEGKTDGEAIDELERWFYIGGATGYVTGFSIVFGALLHNRRARHAFFQCHDSLKDWVYVKVMVFMAKWRRVARA